MIGIGLIVYLSYTLMFWGGTLMNGGPDGSASWPFLYCLLGLGPKPQGLQQTSGSGSPSFPQQGANIVPPGPGHPYPTTPSGGATSLPSQIAAGLPPLPWLASQSSSRFTPSA